MGQDILVNNTFVCENIHCYCDMRIGKLWKMQKWDGVGTTTLQFLHEKTMVAWISAAFARVNCLSEKEYYIAF